MVAVLYYDTFKTPLGRMVALSNGVKIIGVDYGTIETFEKNKKRWLTTHFGDYRLVKELDYVKEAKKELMEYFQKERQQFTFEFKLYGTDFQKKVWHALIDSIPFGQSKSYKEMAKMINNPKAIRAVGGAVNKNPLSIVVPCHRVVGVDGQLIGYNGGLDKKAYLLDHELLLTEK